MLFLELYLFLVYDILEIPATSSYAFVNNFNNREMIHHESLGYQVSEN